MTRRRHQRKEIEDVLRLAEDHRWRVESPPKGYFKMKCPCGQHLKWVARTPSNPNYHRNLEGWLRQRPCWEEEA